MDRRNFLGSLLGVATAGAAVQASVPVGDTAPLDKPIEIKRWPTLVCNACGDMLFTSQIENQPSRLRAECFRCRKAWMVVLPPMQTFSAEITEFKV